VETQDSPRIQPGFSRFPPACVGLERNDLEIPMQKKSLLAAIALLFTAGTLPGIAQAHERYERGHVVYYGHVHRPGCGHVVVVPRYYRPYRPVRYYGYYAPAPRRVYVAPYHHHPYRR
jgi:hypothetical protein